MEQLISNSELKEFWAKELRTLADQLLEHLRDLSTKIPSISKIPYYLYLNWREIKGKDWILLRIALHFLEDNYPASLLIQDKMLTYVLKEFKDMLNLNSRRMSRTKFKEFELALSSNAVEQDLGHIPLQFVPSVREWKGNYQGKFRKLIQRIFSLRFVTERRAKRQERIRGYRDHGSMSTVDERARREANTLSPLGPLLLTALELVREAGYSI